MRTMIAVTLTCFLLASTGNMTAQENVITGFRQVNTDNLEMYYELHKAEELDVCRKPLVLIGGVLTDSALDLRPIAEALSSDRDVLVIDPRGSGRTGPGPTPGDYTLAQHNADLHQMIEATWNNDSDRRPVVVACSDRGKLGLVIGLTGAQRISGLVLCGASAAGVSTVEGPDHDILEALYAQQVWSRDDWSRYRRTITALPPFAESLPVARWFASLVRKRDFEDGVRRNRFLSTVTVGGVQFISDPTLVLHGAEDTVYDPATAPLLASAIGLSADFRLIEGAPHAFWLTHQNRFLQELRNFVSASSDTCD